MFGPLLTLPQNLCLAEFKSLVDNPLLLSLKAYVHPFCSKQTNKQTKTVLSCAGHPVFLPTSSCAVHLKNGAVYFMMFRLLQINVTFPLPPQLVSMYVASTSVRRSVKLALCYSTEDCHWRTNRDKNISTH